MAAIETLLHEMPLIASDIPVMKELSENGKYFDLFPVGNDLVLSEMIKKTIRLSETKKDRRKTAKNYALKNFGTLRFTRELAEIYE